MSVNIRSLGALTLSVLLASACGGSVSEESNNAGGTSGASGSGASGGSGGTAGTGGDSGAAGVAGTGGATGGSGGGGAAGDAGSGGYAPVGGGETFAVSHLYFGDTDTNGVPSSSAWKSFGENLDGQDTADNELNHCMLQPGASSSSIHEDGDNGIDNSFGAHLIPIFVGLSSDMSTRVNEGIENGDFSHLIRIEGLGAGTGTLPASVYEAGPLGSTPAWDGSDVWPVLCEGMATCLDTGTPQIADGNESSTVFPNSVVNGSLWDSTSTASFNLGLTFMGVSWSMPIERAHMTLDVVQPSASSAGMLSGVIDAEDAIASLQQVAGHISTSLCSGPTMDAVAEQFRAASDIMLDGTQDPTQQCNAISLGIGFEAELAMIGTVLDKQPVLPDPCQ